MSVLKTVFVYGIFFICLSWGSRAHSQNHSDSFSIISIGNRYTSEQINLTIEKTNLYYHRFLNSDNILSFDDGTEVKIYSNVKLEELNLPVKEVFYSSEYPEAYVTPLFSIGAGNHLLEVRNSVIPKKH